MLFNFFTSKALTIINIILSVIWLVGGVLSLIEIDLINFKVFFGIFFFVAMTQLLVGGKLIYRKEYAIPIVGIHILFFVLSILLLLLRVDLRISFSLELMFALSVIAIYFSWFRTKRYKSFIDKLKLAWVLLFHTSLVLASTTKTIIQPVRVIIENMDQFVFLPLVYFHYKRLLFEDSQKDSKADTLSE
jgi:hypothetical protein